MAPSKVPLQLPEEELKRLLLLATDAERSAFFESRPETASLECVEQLCDAATKLLRVDLEQVEHINLALSWLAEHLEDDYCRGRAARSAANLSSVRGQAEIACKGYDRAVALFRSADEDFERALTCMSGLQSLLYLGDYEKAARWADFARSVFEREGDSLRLARLNFNYANVLFRRDHWEEAATRYQEAFTELKEIGSPGDIAICLANMAVCHLSMHDFEEAFSLYQQARSFCETNDLPLVVAEIDYNIAYLFLLRGEYSEALKRYREARVTCIKLGDYYRENLCSLDEAEIFLELNLTSEAVDLAQQAHAGFEDLKIAYESAKALVLWGIALSRQGKWFVALELLGKAKEIFRREENVVWTCQVDLHSALVLLRAGRLFESSRSAKDALKGFQELGLTTKSAVCELAIARGEMAQSNWPTAQEWVERALATLRQSDVPAVGYQAHFLLGEILEAQQDPEGALGELRLSHRDLERVRSHLQSEELKVPLLDDKLQVYERLFLLLVQDPSEERNAEAFGFVEKAKARSIADLVASRAHALPSRDGGRSNLATTIRRLREELNWYYRQIDLQEMRADVVSSSSLSPLRKASRERENSLLRSLGELQATDKELSSLQQAYTARLSAIRTTLPNETTALDYYVAGGTVFAVLLEKSRLEIVPLSVLGRVEELLRSLRFQLRKHELGLEEAGTSSDAATDSTRQLLRELHRELLAPLDVSSLKPNLLIIPHGALHLLPFHALLDGETYLCDTHAITYSPSTTVAYLLAIRPPPTSSGALVLGATNGPDESLSREIQQVSLVLPDSRVLRGKEIDDEAFTRVASHARYVHLASSSDFRNDNPMFSSIQLRGRSLNLFDVLNLSLDTDVFTLTGCGAELGGAPKADAFMGLTRSLLHAGARSVLVSLWNTDSSFAGDFVSSFYEKLLTRKNGKAVALQDTMREMRANDPNPFRWSSFVLVGDPG